MSMPVPDDSPPDWPDMLTVVVDRAAPAVRVLGLRGDVNAFTAPDLEQIIDGQLAAAPRVLVLDLGELEFLGLDGVFVLVCAAYRARMDHIGFCLAAANKSVAEALYGYGVVEALDLHDSVADALRTYG
jgi:anti-anti-sigma factor